MTGLLFITASNADHKAINRALLYLRNWEYGEESINWDELYVVPHKNGHNFPALPEGMGEIKGTSPPIGPDFENAWAGCNLTEVEEFVLDTARNADERQLGFNTSLYFCLDNEGLEEGTCIVAERGFDDDAEEHTNEFRKVRVPWAEVSAMHANLDIANADFEDYCDEEGGDASGWWTYGNMGPDISEEKLRKREQVVQEFERNGTA